MSNHRVEAIAAEAPDVAEEVSEVATTAVVAAPPACRTLIEQAERVADVVFLVVLYVILAAQRDVEFEKKEWKKLLSESIATPTL